MADEIADLLLTAWQRVRQTLRHRPTEVLRRLRRGRELWKKRPPRAWCFAIRAADTRIASLTARHLRSTPTPHRVTIDRDLLAKLTERVRIHPWGEPEAEIAQRLGRGKLGLRIARAKGKLRTHHDQPTGGLGGNPRPIVAIPDDSDIGTLDPGAHLFQPADRAWGWTGKLAYWRLPDELPPQAIERIPFFIDRTRAYARDTSTLHPEHPLVDPPPRKPSPYNLGKPRITDNAAYKWKGDQYVGYDWRAAETNPRIRASYERHQHRLERVRNWRKQRAAQGDARPARGSGGGGSLVFRGWYWLCPACGRRSKVLYYPLPPVNLLRGYGTLIEDNVIEAALATDPALRTPLRAPGLACHKCLGVTGIGRARNGAWNEIVAYLTGGLLYGHEVPAPKWFTPDRKRPFRSCPNRAPSKRLPQIEAQIRRGLSYTQIARELDLNKATVAGHARRLFKQHHVHTRAEFGRKFSLAPTGVRPPRIARRMPQIIALLLRGLSYTQIARELGITKSAVVANVQRLVKRHNVRGRANLIRILAGERTSIAEASR